MIRGMTGFGRAQGAGDWGAWQWEVRSVNGRGVDGRVNCPPGFEPVEFEARKRLKDRFARGNFQLQLRIDADQQSAVSSVNAAALSALTRRIRLTTGKAPSDTAIAQLMLSPAILDARRAGVELTDEIAADVLAGLDKAFTALEGAREEEGATLSTILLDILSEVARLAAHARQLAGEQPNLIRERYETRIRELDAGDKVEPEKLAQEILLLANKADVREELDRLDAHIESGRSIIGKEEPAGRKLDFLCQELNRETNTLCAKSASLELTNVGLELKSLIDQFREQVQNVE